MFMVVAGLINYMPWSQTASSGERGLASQMDQETLRRLENWERELAKQLVRQGGQSQTTYGQAPTKLEQTAFGTAQGKFELRPLPSQSTARLKLFEVIETGQTTVLGQVQVHYDESGQPIDYQFQRQ